MEIVSETHGQVLLMRPEGRLDTETAGELELSLHDAFESGRRHFVLDMAKISYVSSAGLRVLLALAKKVDGGVGSLRLAALNASVKQVFDIAGFTSLFEIYPNAKLALQKHPHTGESAPAGSPIGNLAAGLLGVPAAAPTSSAQQSTAAAAARLLGVRAAAGESDPKSDRPVKPR